MFGQPRFLGNDVYVFSSPTELPNATDSQRFNQHFFENNVVIGITSPFGSSSYSMRIDSLIREDDEIQINVTIVNRTGDMLLLDSERENFLIGVKKSDIAGVTRFSLHQTKEDAQPVPDSLSVRLRPTDIMNIRWFVGDDNLPKGVEIPFYSSPALGLGCSMSNNMVATRRSYILRSLEELELFKTAVKCHDNCNDTDYYDKFSEDFFQENAVIAMFVEHNTIVNSLLRIGNAVYVERITHLFMSRNGVRVAITGGACQSYYVLVEVDKEAVSGVTQLAEHITRQDIVIEEEI
jgi:hypothetical protein